MRRVGEPDRYRNEVLAVVVKVHEDRLSVLLWRRGLAPQRGRWALPGGFLGPDEDLDASIARHLAAKVDVRQLAHVEQLNTLSAPRRLPHGRVVATTYLGLVPAPAQPSLPEDTQWLPVDDL